MTAVAAALIPAAAARSAWRRWGVAAYGCFVELGARGLVARSSAAGGVVVAAGEPGAVPIAPKLLNTSVWKTALTVCRSELRLFFFQAEDGIRDYKVTGVQTCALPI